MDLCWKICKRCEANLSNSTSNQTGKTHQFRYIYNMMIRNKSTYRANSSDMQMRFVFFGCKLSLVWGILKVAVNDFYRLVIVRSSVGFVVKHEKLCIISLHFFFYLTANNAVDSPPSPSFSPLSATISTFGYFDFFYSKHFLHMIFKSKV